MFGFWSFLPLSTIDSIYYNGEDFGIILHIQQDIPQDRIISRDITFDLNIQKEKIIIL